MPYDGPINVVVTYKSGDIAYHYFAGLYDLWDWQLGLSIKELRDEIEAFDVYWAE